MRKTTVEAKQSCPKCGALGKQRKAGFSEAGTQRYICNHCGSSYMLEPKTRAYSEDVRQAAIKVYYSGVSGRGVGKVFGMSKANVYNWIKKTERSVDKSEN